MRLELVDEADDGLSRDRWEIDANIGYSSSLNVTLSSWCRQGRATRRHKWARNGEGYARRSHNGHHHWGNCRPASEVPVPDRLNERIQEALLSNLVITWATDPPT